MKLKGNKKSKRQKTSLKYNNQKRVREHRRRVRKEAKKQGARKRMKKDPGIPNSWPFKAEMLQELERKKEEKEKDLAQRRARAKAQAKKDQAKQEANSRQVAQDREAQRRAKRAQEAQKRYKEHLRQMLLQADVLLQVLDARDPIGCRCAELEAWAQEKGKRVVFVLAKADLVAPQVAVQWLQVLGQVCPTVAVQAEAGRDGIRELLQMLGRSPLADATQATPASAPAAAVGVVGYPQTGKRILCKAIRKEAEGPVPWLLEHVGRLLPATEPACVAATVHLTIRAALSHSASRSSDVAPLDIVRHVLERTTKEAVMRRFRLPTFEGAEGFLTALAKERDLKNKRGNPLRPETTARHVVAELFASPGCICTPPDVLNTSSPVMWSAHTAAKSLIETVMHLQLGTLRSRGGGPSAGALAITSGGLGPAVNLTSLLVDEEAEAEADAEMDVAGGDQDADGSEDGEGEEEEADTEGEEEECVEGEESEEEDGENKGMEH